MNKIAIGRVVLTNREHIIALEPFDKGLMGTLLRYPYEVRDAAEYFDDIQDVKVTKDMLELARHIVNQKAGHFEPDKFEDQYETAPDRPDQPEARRQTHCREGASAGRERRGSDGRAAQEHRWWRWRGPAGAVEEAGQEVKESGVGPEGNADADRRQEGCEGSGCEEARGQGAAEVGLTRHEASGDAGRSLLRRPRQVVADGEPRSRRRGTDRSRQRADESSPRRPRRQTER
jgi:hypothetical protein